MCRMGGARCPTGLRTALDSSWKRASASHSRVTGAVASPGKGTLCVLCLGVAEGEASSGGTMQSHSLSAKPVWMGEILVGGIQPAQTSLVPSTKKHPHPFNFQCDRVEQCTCHGDIADDCSMRCRFQTSILGPACHHVSRFRPGGKIVEGRVEIYSKAHGRDSVVDDMISIERGELGRARGVPLVDLY